MTAGILLVTALIAALSATAASLGYVIYRMQRLPRSAPRAFLAQGNEGPARPRRLVVCLGDSNTHGHIGPAYVDLLEAAWEFRGYRFINAGINGDLAWNAAARLDEIIACAPDHVFVCLGSNDALACLCDKAARGYVRHKNLAAYPSENGFRKSLSEVLGRLRTESRAKVTVLTLPCASGPLDHPLNLQLEKFSKIAAEIAAQQALEVLPLQEVQRKAILSGPGNGTGRRIEKELVSRTFLGSCLRYLLCLRPATISRIMGSAYTTDGLHLNDLGVRQVAELIGGVLEREAPLPLIGVRVPPARRGGRAWDVTDWIGAWFPILEKRGHCTEVVFGRLRAGQKAVDWHFFAHQDFDGVGGMVFMLRRLGATFPKEVIPVLRESGRPGLFEYLGGILRNGGISGLRKERWRNFHPKPGGPSRPVGVAWHLFSNEESDRIAERARAAGATVNSFLFWNLDRATRDLWLAPAPAGKTARRWMMPVNVRGPLWGARDTANHASYLGLDIDDSTTPADVHRSVRDKLKGREHWGAVWGLLLGRWVGLRGMELMQSYYEDGGHQWTGTFSNLGAWPPPGVTGAPDDQGWLLCPPATTGHPIATGCCAWRGRIGVTVQLHPALSMDVEDAWKTLREWVSYSSGPSLRT